MRSVRRGLALLVLLLFGVAVVGCGSLSGATGATAGSTFEGLVIQPPKPAPALALRNYTGQPVNLTAFRGKAVLVNLDARDGHHDHRVDPVLQLRDLTVCYRRHPRLSAARVSWQWPPNDTSG